MALFSGGAVPLHRQLKGLLLPGLPRGQIPARRAGEGHPSPVPPLRPVQALPSRRGAPSSVARPCD